MVQSIIKLFRQHCEETAIPGAYVTRMHSSRMRATRLLPVSPSMHCSWGGVPAKEGVPARGVYLPGGYLPGGCTCQGVPAQGVYLPGGVPARGVYLPRWGVPAKGGIPLVNRMTDRCKNITLPHTSFAGGNNPKSSAKKRQVNNVPTFAIFLTLIHMSTL